MRSRLLSTVDYVQMLEILRERRVNYEPHEVRRPNWNFDEHRHNLAREDPGDPEADGPWHVACGLVADYEFSDPKRIRAIYRRGDPLLDRTMLLEGRFYVLRFYMGVRISEVIDETRGRERVWGWAYETLQGHLERGKMTYRVIKNLDTGLVEFVVTGYSQASPTQGSITRLGWYLFGRRTQLRFYERCGRRLRDLLEASSRGVPAPSPARETLENDDLVLAPSDTGPHPLDRITLAHRDPGT